MVEQFQWAVVQRSAGVGLHFEEAVLWKHLAEQVQWLKIQVEFESGLARSLAGRRQIRVELQAQLGRQTFVLVLAICPETPAAAPAAMAVAVPWAPRDWVTARSRAGDHLVQEA